MRASNEDAFFADDALGLFVVADGMGGHNAGEVASRTAIEVIEHFVRRSHGASWIPWPYGTDPRLSCDGNRLRTAILLANRRVLRLSETSDDLAGMGSTVACVLVGHGRAAVAHAGDSRVYLLSDGELTCLTEDDSWLQRAARSVAPVDPATGAAGDMRNVLTNVLGVTEDVEVHVQEIELEPGDRLLLSSDGLHGVLDDGTLVHWAGAPDLPSIPTKLLETAVTAGSRDNITALVVGWDEDET